MSYLNRIQSPYSPTEFNLQSKSVDSTQDDSILSSQDDDSLHGIFTYVSSAPPLSSLNTNSQTSCIFEFEDDKEEYKKDLESSSPYTLNNLIAQGSFGSVYKASHTNDPEKTNSFAIKCFFPTEDLSYRSISQALQCYSKEIKNYEYLQEHANGESLQYFSELVDSAEFNFSGNSIRALVFNYYPLTLETASPLIQASGIEKIFIIQEDLSYVKNKKVKSTAYKHLKFLKYICLNLSRTMNKNCNKKIS